ncbi:MAG: hypothetical protein FWE31_02805 [Firmicutes bacterium]|nr:hypothetical protein [Bacillota bacterium]
MSETRFVDNILGLNDSSVYSKGSFGTKVEYVEKLRTAYKPLKEGVIADEATLKYIGDDAFYSFITDYRAWLVRNSDGDNVQRYYKDHMETWQKNMASHLPGGTKLQKEAMGEVANLMKSEGVKMFVGIKDPGRQQERPMTSTLYKAPRDTSNLGIDLVEVVLELGGYSLDAFKSESAKRQLMDIVRDSFIDLMNAADEARIRSNNQPKEEAVVEDKDYMLVIPRNPSVRVRPKVEEVLSQMEVGNGAS